MVSAKKVFLYLVLAVSIAGIEFYLAWTTHFVTRFADGAKWNIQTNCSRFLEMATLSSRTLSAFPFLQENFLHEPLMWLNQMMEPPVLDFASSINRDYPARNRNLCL
jgi:hypothetical protein